MLITGTKTGKAMKKYIGIAGIWLLALAAPAAAQNRVVLLPESEVQIDGTSTVDDFTCRAGTVRGSGAIAGERALVQKTLVQKAVLGGKDETNVRIRVPVATFDCGKRRMNEDLYRALRAKAHPFIEYELVSAELVGDEGQAGAYRLRARGRLTIAGTTRDVEVVLEGERLPDGRFQGRGRLPLQMTDFGIEPPSALLGLVRAHDDITVRFNLVAAPEDVQARNN